jgi:hypothetical protein
VVLGLGACVVLFAAVIGRAATFKLSGLKLQDQEAAFNQLRQDLQPGDKLYVHGAVEVLVLLNKPNINPYIDFDWGKDEFLTSRRGLSFSQIVDEMEAQAPRYVAITRLRKVYHRKELERWVDESYQPLELLRYKSLYVRK